MSIDQIDSTSSIDSYFDVVPDDSPLDNLRRYDGTRLPPLTAGGSRNYKCPNCGGEFNQWAKRYYKYMEDGTTQLSVGRTGAEEQQCPFCGMAKFSYDETNSQKDD